MLPRIKHIRPNFTQLISDEGTLYFSYETLIAFEVDGTLTIRKNDWGPTTGRHLNEINPDKSIRVDRDTFRERWSLIFS
jgi:hypothetical protein